MVRTSHARCRGCGQARHKFARFNLCQQCWVQIKPDVREGWKRIKERRALRRAVEAHLQGFHPSYQQEALFVTTEAAVASNGTDVDTLDDIWEQLRNDGVPSPAEREQMIARIRKIGVPQEGTPERALYMRLFRGRQQPNEQRTNLIARLYTDSDVPVSEIIRSLGIDANEIARVRRKRNLSTREDMRPYRPSAHILDNEELVASYPWTHEAVFFRDEITGIMRPVWDGPEPEPIPEPAPEPEPAPIPEPEPEPVPVAPTTRQRRPPITETERQEIIRLFMDPDIPVHEIQREYNLTNGGLYSMLERAGIKGGRKGLKTAPNVDQGGHFRMVDGKQTWVPGDAVQQLHLGQAEAATVAETLDVIPMSTQLAVPQVVLQERSWAVQYVVTRTALVAGASIEDALRNARERLGSDIDVIRIERS